MPTANHKSNEPKAEIVSALLSSGDSWIKLLTLALIILGGAGNWFATKNVGDESRQDWKEARSEINQFFKNQQTYLQGLQLLQQNNQDTAWIKNALQQNGEVSRSNNAELAALKDELEKLKKQLSKPPAERNFQ